MCVKIRELTANPSDAEELAILNAVFASLRVCKVIHEVVVWVGGFREDVSDEPVVFYLDQSVQETDLILGYFKRKFEVS